MAFDELQWLLGRWADDWRRGEPGEATDGGESWDLQLDGQILVRTSWCTYPSAGGRPAFRHDDLLIVFHDLGAQIRAIFWDTDGHVIRYVTAVLDPDRRGFAFESDPSVPGPGQRLHYRATDDNHLRADFNLRLPGAPAFTPYLEWTSTKAASG